MYRCPFFYPLTAVAHKARLSRCRGRMTRAPRALKLDEELPLKLMPEIMERLKRLRKTLR